MKFRELDVNLLFALDILLEEKSVSRAAAKLGLTQGAVSVHLGKLRDHFQDDLLVQVGRRMELTAFAEELTPFVSRLLVRLRATVNRRPWFDPKTARRHFRFATADLEIATILTRVNRRLSQEAPDISIRVKELHPGQILERATVEHFLNRGNIDFVIIPKGTQSNHHRFDVLNHPDPYVCITWKKNTHVQDSITSRQYLSLKHVIRLFGDDDCETFDSRHLNAIGIKRKIATIVEAYSHIPMMLIGTPYIATIPARWAYPLTDQFDLRILPCPISIPCNISVLQWQNHLDQDPATRWLRQILREEARQQDVEIRKRILPFKFRCSEADLPKTLMPDVVD